MQVPPRVLPGVDDVRLRPAHAGDMVHLDELIRSSFHALSIGSYSEDERSAALSGHMSADFHLVSRGEMWVADHRGRLYACAAWTRTPADGLHQPLVRDADVPSACIRSVFVDPRVAGRGLGRRMVELMEGLAAEAGVRRLLLVSTLNARPMYQRMGYRAQGVVPVPVTEDVELIGTLMVRDLDGAAVAGTSPACIGRVA